MTGNDSSKACAIACQNCAGWSVFPSDMTSHSKIAHFNCEGIAPRQDDFMREFSHAPVPDSSTRVIPTEL